MQLRHGDEFNLFIQSISQPAIIFFDEFKKVYKENEEETQEQMFTLFNGVSLLISKTLPTDMQQ
jgi:hypothetical protein